MIGETIGRYTILARLGAGGMGVVYKARDPRLERIVAVKLLPPERTRDEQAKRRFLHEARTASALDHANICTIHEIDETPDGQLYLVMAFYEGETLASRIDRGRLDLAEALNIARQVAAGLGDAHRVGVVHRDIKPANLLLARNSVVKILDFGLAKLVGSGAATQTGMISGTVAYMSPEQVQGHELDHRTDIWSLGVVLFEMLTGHRPFRGDNLLALSRSIVDDTPATLSRLRGDAGDELDRLLARALAKRPSDRYQSLSAFHADLVALSGEAADSARAPATAILAALEPTAERPRSASGSAGTRIPPSIAVLPFADMSPQKDQEYFCEGMAEELINALTTIEGLHVAARTSSFQFKGQGVGVSEIGQRLRVAAVLEGSVRKAGNRLRITAQLVKASDGYHLWSERYDRDMDDIFAVQDEIARSVVGKLRVRLLTDTVTPLVRRHTDNIEAYHAFLRGRHCRFTLYDLRSAIGFFEKAVALDPSYALSHAAIADCFNILGLYSVLAPAAAAAKAKTCAARALALDDSLPEAVGALAQWTFLFDWDWLEADRLFRHAIELRPGGVEIYCWYGYFLATMGLADEGLAQIRYASAIDPLSPYVAGYEATALYVAGRFDEAIARADEALQIQPGFGLGLNTKAFGTAAAGRPDAAVTLAEQLVAVSNRTSHSLGVLGSMQAQAGRLEAARATLAELEERQRAGYVSPVSIAGVLADLGDHDRAWAAFEDAFRTRATTLHSIWFAQYRSVHGDARADDLRRRMKLPPYSPLLRAEVT